MTPSNGTDLNAISDIEVLKMLYDRWARAYRDSVVSGKGAESRKLKDLLFELDKQFVRFGEE